MKARWLYVGFVLLLFLALIVGVPLFPELLAWPLWGRVNVGMAVYLALLLAPLVFSALYLRSLRRPKH